MKRMLMSFGVVVGSVAAAAPASQVARWRASDLVRWLVAGLMLAYPIVTFDRGAPVWCGSSPT